MEQTMELRDELRAFYEKEERKRGRLRWGMLVAAWLAAGSGLFWLCKIALHWHW